MTWLCAGCGIKADSDFLTGCGCPTGVLFDRDSMEQRRKGETCHRHEERPSRVNLDGDNLCQECADEWCRSEGRAALSTTTDAPIEAGAETA